MKSKDEGIFYPNSCAKVIWGLGRDNSLGAKSDRLNEHKFFQFNRTRCKIKMIIMIDDRVAHDNITDCQFICRGV